MCGMCVWLMSFEVPQQKPHQVHVHCAPNRHTIGTKEILWI